MNYYHKSFRIISRPDRDPENKLFRALITIETCPGPVYIENIAPCLEPAAGQFDSEREAESHGIEWGIVAIDQGFMEGRFFRRL